LGDKFELIKQRYADVNTMFGDIVKVTPSSKVVGDMAQFMVANDISPEDVFARGEQLAFPESVVSFFMGEIGQPTGGFPVALQQILLKGKTPFTDRPNKHLEPLHLEAEFEAFKLEFGDDLTYTMYLAYKFYPKVTAEAIRVFRLYGDVSVIPTPYFFYGMKAGEETTIEIAKGKTLLIRLLSIGPADDRGMRTVFFKLNGQTRNIEIQDKSVKVTTAENRKVDKLNPAHIGSPLQGLLSKVFVKAGDMVKKNQPMFMIEAMKMESNITAIADCVVKSIVLKEGTIVNTDDLVLEV
jgi:pyruvate carboxylase